MTKRYDVYQLNNSGLVENFGRSRKQAEAIIAKDMKDAELTAPRLGLRRTDPDAGPVAKLKDANRARVSNVARLQSASSLRYQVCVFDAHGRVYTRASYASLPVAEKIAAKAEGKVQIYDNVLRMRIGGQNLHRTA